MQLFQVPRIVASTWPDAMDRLTIAFFLLAVVALPLLGYVFVVLDIRAHLRALRGMLVRVAVPEYHVPEWIQDETPPCLRALGLQLPCSEDDVKEAYRRMAKELHPDRGGDVRRFLQLQEQLEQAYHFLRQRSTK